MTKSVSSIFNYILKDPIIDFFKYHGKTKGFFPDSFYNKTSYSFEEFIINLGYKWENKVIEYIKNKINVITVEKSDNALEETIKLINTNTPVINQGFLKNEYFHGYVDLLIHVDYIKELFDNVNDDIFNFLERKDIKYVPIDIKLSYNEKNKHYNKYIQTQLYLYGNMLYKILGKETNLIMGFVISKQSLKGKIKINVLKLTDYLQKDAFEAYNWLERVKNEGVEWDIFKMQNIELYPNMKNLYDSKWKNAKKIIANNKNEITNLYYCCSELKEKCFNNKIYNFKDPNFIKVLESKYKSNSNTLQIIKDMINNKENEILKTKIKIRGKILYIDIENIYNHYKHILDEYNELNNELIVQIGIGFLNNENNWEYKSFDSYNYSLRNENEEKIIKDFKKYIEYIQNENDHITFVCYTKAENKLFEKLDIKNYSVIDLHEETKKLRLKGLYSYSLKNVIKALNERQILEINYDNCEIKDGISAMILVLKKDKEKLNEHDINELKKYNEIDCRCLYELFKILFE